MPSFDTKRSFFFRFLRNNDERGAFITFYSTNHKARKVAKDTDLVRTRFLFSVYLLVLPLVDNDH